jgi:hypothetical protein
VDAETDTMADGEAFEMKGVVTLVDAFVETGGLQSAGQAERERVRSSRLKDVMIILEANAAAIATAVCERLQGEEAGRALGGVTLVPDDHGPAFTARFHPAVENGAAAAALGQYAGILGAALEGELLAAIQSRVSSNRLFKPAISLGFGTPPLAPPKVEPPQRSVAGTENGLRPVKRTVSGKGRFWLMLGFLLIAIVLLMAGYLIADQLT